MKKKTVKSENEFRTKIMKCAKKAGYKVTYVALLLYYVLSDPHVSLMDKAKIYSTLCYFFLPFDLIPDYIPIIGYSDDLAALLWAIRSVWSNITPQMEQRAKLQLQEWFGTDKNINLYSIIEIN